MTCFKVSSSKSTFIGALVIIYVGLYVLNYLNDYFTYSQLSVLLFFSTILVYLVAEQIFKEFTVTNDAFIIKYPLSFIRSVKSYSIKNISVVVFEEFTDTVNRVSKLELKYIKENRLSIENYWFYLDLDDVQKLINKLREKDVNVVVDSNVWE